MHGRWRRGGRWRRRQGWGEVEEFRVEGVVGRLPARGQEGLRLGWKRGQEGREVEVDDESEERRGLLAA